MIKYLIIDDEHMAHEIIKGYCDMLPNMSLVKHCYDALEALDCMRENTVDLIFLDLNMPKLKAVNKATQVKTTVPPVNLQAENIQPEHIFLYSDKKHVQVKVTDVLYMEAAGNYAKVVLRDNTLLVREKISDLLARLASSDFIQVHKSFVVAKLHIVSVEGNRIQLAGHTVPIGKLYRANVLKLLE